MVPCHPDHLFLKAGRAPIRHPFTPDDLANNWSSSRSTPETTGNIGEGASPIDGLMTGEAVVGLTERWVDWGHLESAGIEWFRPGPLHYLSCLMFICVRNDRKYTRKVQNGTVRSWQGEEGDSVCPIADQGTDC